MFFAVVFAISGFAAAGGNIVSNNMMLEIAPPSQRPLYVGFMNTVLGLGTLIPIIGGALIDLFGYDYVFALSVVICLLALLMTRNLTNKRRVT